MQTEAEPTIAIRAEEAVEVEGETAMDLYTTLEPRPARLRHDQAARR
jgi:hypothetical protein